ncbi:hypothetical protein N186_05930 [Thermofilum adornatum]|uniref:Uncharacterized protein n=1 Tax=Thermofilum adornatum TaxID=1365176 RepID=S5ZLL4_9CREN|nr:hypothetical protein N186_05930 [Thermofilum adornatum]
MVYISPIISLVKIIYKTHALPQKHIKIPYVNPGKTETL